MGAHQIIAGKLTLGGFFSYNLFMGFLVAPMFQIVSIGTQITEAVAGLERTHEVLSEHAEDRDPERTITLNDIDGLMRFEHVDFAYDPAKPVERRELRC